MSEAPPGAEKGARSFRMYIDGEWVEAASGRTYALPNPATEEIIATAPDAGREDMQRAIAAARRAFDDGSWSRLGVPERADLLRRIADRLEERKEEFRQLLVAAHACEYMTHFINLDTPIELLRHYADLVQRFEFERTLPTRVGPSPAGPMVVFLSSDQASWVTGQIFGCGGERVTLLEQPCYGKTVLRSGGWTVEALVESFREHFGTSLEPFGIMKPPYPFYEGVGGGRN